MTPTAGRRRTESRKRSNNHVSRASLAVTGVVAAELAVGGLVRASGVGAALP